MGGSIGIACAGVPERGNGETNPRERGPERGDRLVRGDRLGEAGKGLKLEGSLGPRLEAPYQQKED